MHFVLFQHYLINRTTFGKQNIADKVRVLILYTTLSQTFLILKRIQRDIIINIIRTDLPWGHPAPYTMGTGSLFQG